MKPNNLKDFRKLSNIVTNDKDLLVQSTKANFEENTYKSELWKYSKNTWKKYKDSKTKALTPGLGRLPIIGGLFRHKLKDVEKTQLLVFIAPRMV